MSIICHEVNASIESGSTHINTLVSKNISIRFCDIVSILINIENATMTDIRWRTVNDPSVIHSTPIPLESITQVRFDVTHGFVDGIEFHNSSSTGKNCIKGAVSCDQSDVPLIFSPTRVADALFIRMILLHYGSWITIQVESTE